MKIRTTTYSINRKSKYDTRLTIGMEVLIPKGEKIDTSATVQLNPIGYFIGKVPDAAFAMLYLSAIVYAIDRSVSRGRFSVDGWSREFDVEISIPCVNLFKQIESKINSMLSYLTGDYWECHFVGDATMNPMRFGKIDAFEGITQVNLFSGGMDSLIGAIDYMTDFPGGKLFLASHYDSKMPGPQTDQKGLKGILRTKYPNKFSCMPAVLITPGQSFELSSRSRSLMFLSIALVVASYANCKVVVPENGSVSLNYPLSPSRRASCSTRTTHPVFLKQFRVVVGELGLTCEIDNPYEKMTKGEMVRGCSDKDYLLSIVDSSNSCGKRSKHQYMYDNHNATHCGHCMPCMYRKASMVGETDKTTYGNTFATLFKRKGSKLSEDFFAMLDFLKKSLTREDIKRELMIAGMGRFDDLDDYVDLVIRTRAELESMIRVENVVSVNKYMGWI